MSSGIPQQRATEIEDIVDVFRAALVVCVTTTGYAHFEVNCSLINQVKDIVLVELMVGTKHSFTVLRRLQRARGNMRFPGGRIVVSSIPQQQAVEIENTVDLFRAALILGVTETGYAHIDVDCSMTDHEKEIVRVVLLVGTKYSRTISRSSWSLSTKIELN